MPLIFNAQKKEQQKTQEQQQSQQPPVECEIIARKKIRHYLNKTFPYN